MPALRCRRTEGGGGDPRPSFGFGRRGARLGLCVLAACAGVACQDDAAGRMPDAHADSDSLRVRVVSPAEAGAGRPVRIALQVENVTDRPLNLYVTGRTIAFDIIVENEDGAVEWRRLDGQVVSAILRVETLVAHDTLVLSDTWDQRSNEGRQVEAGTYTVRGEVLTDGEPLVAPAVPLRIGPPKPD